MKIVPGHWEDGVYELVFHVGRNPKNNRVYIRGERGFPPDGRMYSLSRVLLEQFNKSYFDTITGNGMIKAPRCVREFVVEIVLNKKKIIENVESEIIGLISYEANKLHKNVIELDSTKSSRKTIVNQIVKHLKDGRPLK